MTFKSRLSKRFRLKNQHNGCVKLSLPLLRHNHNGTKETENYLKVAAKITFKVVPFFYVNDSRTPWANSDYRRLNRTATNQTGTIDKSFLMSNQIQTTWVVSTSC